MVSLSEQKYHLFYLISQIDNPGLLQWLEAELLKKQTEFASGKNGTPEKSSRHSLQEKLKKPIRAKLDPEALKIAQGWKGHDEKALMNAIRDLKVEESIDELLALISA